MYRGVIIFAPEEPYMEQLARRIGDSLDSNSFKVEIKPAVQAEVPDLAAADFFVLGSSPQGDRPIHEDFDEILRALRGMTLAGRVGGVFAVASDRTLKAFDRALRDCELNMPEENYKNLKGADSDSAELSAWMRGLSEQMENRPGGC